MKKNSKSPKNSYERRNDNKIIRHYYRKIQEEDRMDELGYLIHRYTDMLKKLVNAIRDSRQEKVNYIELKSVIDRIISVELIDSINLFIDNTVEFVDDIKIVKPAIFGNVHYFKNIRNNGHRYISRKEIYLLKEFTRTYKSRQVSSKYLSA